MAGEYIEFNNNSQPALNDTNINRLQQLIKQDIQGAVSGDTLPIGAIMPFGSDTIPDNWLLCNGQAISRTTYQDLFNTIGITYGSGDGFTTFNLPDLQGKIPVGLDENDTDFDTLGNTGGEKEHTLTINEMPSHTHKYHANLAFTGSGSDGTGLKQGSDLRPNDTIDSTGGGQPHNILQPYIVQNYIIKAKQSAGIVATVVDGLNSTSATDALSAKQGKILKEIIEGTVLYENSEGTISDIEFDATNYNTFEIYYYSTWNETNRLCIRKCLKNRNTELVSIELLGHAMIENTQVEINDSGMEVKYRRYTYVKVDSGVSYSTDSNEIKISKIIGYK